MALPTFYRFRCLRKEAYDESLVVMVNYAVWMVVRGFIVDKYANVMVQSKFMKLDPVDLKFSAPQQMTVGCNWTPVIGQSKQPIILSPLS